MTGPEKAALRRRLVEATRDGRVGDWVERLAEVFIRAGLDAAEVNWNECPNHVAFDMVGHAERHGPAALGRLADAVYAAEGVRALMDGKPLPPRM